MAVTPWLANLSLTADYQRTERLLRSWPNDDGTRAILARTNRELRPAVLHQLRDPVEDLRPVRLLGGARVDGVAGLRLSGAGGE